MIGPLGPFEVGIIGVVALLLFGKRLPEVARAMGRSIVEFKEGLKNFHSSTELNPNQTKIIPRAVGKSRKHRPSTKS